jgi:hypothetical protein
MSKNFDSHIAVLPNIPNMNKGKKVDLDVRSVLEKSSLDVMAMEHEPTNEESGKLLSTASWSWLVISLAVIIVVLIIVIVLFVLKENEKYDEKVPNSIIKPSFQQQVNPNFVNNNHQQQQMHQQMQQQQQQQQQMQQQQQQQQQMQMHQQQQMQQQQKQQTEQLPIISKSLQDSKFKQPTKQELENVLRQINQKTPSIEVISDKQNSNGIKATSDKQKQNPDAIKATSGQEQDQDQTLATAFCQNLQQQVDMENADSDDEEGRNEN